ncbi:uncharacterized protein ACOB7L_010029 [Callospermophilus lateralis]|uniref:uncharacterized protein LOC143386430 n=1 Tax=Callospermophilus lateralis TaxID=76772 RepID=UPI0040387F2B
MLRVERDSGKGKKEKGEKEAETEREKEKRSEEEKNDLLQSNVRDSFIDTKDHGKEAPSFCHSMVELPWIHMDRQCQTFSTILDGQLSIHHYEGNSCCTSCRNILLPWGGASSSGWLYIWTPDYQTFGQLSFPLLLNKN